MSPKKTPVHFLDLLKVIHFAMIKDKESIEKYLCHPSWNRRDRNIMITLPPTEHC